MNSKTRTALTAGVLAVALGLGATAQAASAGAPKSVAGRPSDSITRVADFYGAYIDAVTDEDSGNLGSALRAHYLTPGFQKELNSWEEREHADGVLRAQNVPLAWKITDNGTAHHTEFVVTLTWSSSTSSRLVVDVTRDSHQIYRIAEKPAAKK